MYGICSMPNDKCSGKRREENIISILIQIITENDNRDNNNGNIISSVAAHNMQII